MTDQQRKQISALRTHGAGYKIIAGATGLNRDIVRNYCKSHSIIAASDSSDESFGKRLKKGLVCKYCGASLVQPHTGRPRIFCSDSCRFSWAAAHSEEQRKNSPANYVITCANCGCKFTAYGQKNRKYCRRECYYEARFRQSKV